MSTIKLLVVDDDTDFAESLADMLEMYGYATEIAGSGEEAMETLREKYFDLVLMDMKMPGISGIETMARIRSLKPGLKVVMVTAFTKSEFIRQAMQDGAVGILHRPVETCELLDMVSFLPSNGSVLLVDDNPSHADSLKKSLEKEGYRVTVSSDLEMARPGISGGGFQLLLLNLPLPDGLANEFFRWPGGGEGPDVVYITETLPEELDDKPVISLRDIIVKPFNMENMMSVITERTRTSG